MNRLLPQTFNLSNRRVKGYHVASIPSTTEERLPEYSLKAVLFLLLCWSGDWSTSFTMRICERRRLIEKHSDITSATYL